MCFLCTAALPAAELHRDRPKDSHAPCVLWRKHRGEPQTREGNQVRELWTQRHSFGCNVELSALILISVLLPTLPPSDQFYIFLKGLPPFSFPGATLRSSMTPTSITATGCTAPPFPQPPLSVRQWWRCGTVLGEATSPRCTWSHGRSPSATRAPPSSTRNTPRTLTAPRSTTTPRAPAAGLSPLCSWSRVRILVPVSSTQRTCRLSLVQPA